MKKRDSLKGKRLAVFGANNVVDEVTAFARQNGIVLVSVGYLQEAPMHQYSNEQYFLDCTDELTMIPFFKEKQFCQSAPFSNLPQTLIQNSFIAIPGEAVKKLMYKFFIFRVNSF